MNSYIHSHTNSESENLTLKEILPIFLDDFIKDLSFYDICDYVNRDYPIFTEEEINRIKSLHDEKQQIILMFFILIDNNKNIEKFLDVLQYDFKWLRTKIIQKLYDKEIIQYLNVVQNLRSNFPKHSDFNVHRLKYFSLLRDELKRLKPRQYLVIYGELGLGKKWLAIDACCDYGVAKSMGFNIIWLDVHNCDSQEMDIEMLQRLKILLGETSFQKKVGDYDGLSNKILELQQDLRTILKQPEYKDCLLVLSNLQNTKTLETFNLHCKTLIITRNKAITERLQSSLTKRIHISEGLTRHECITLFEKILDIKSIKFPENYNDLFDQCNGHPFLLNIIAQNLKNQSNKEWNKWINNLENFQIGNNKLQNVMKLSLKVLRDDELELFKTLSIFNHSVKIPVKVLAALWDKTEKETEKILKKFDKYSLINIESKDGSKVCIIHFLYYSYLQDCKNVDKIELNKKLVKSFNVENALENRKVLELLDIPSHSYFYHYIGYHLDESKMTEYFSKLYLDFVFVEQKLRITGLSNTIGDFKYFRKNITGNDPYKEELIDNLFEFLPNIEEMIYKSKDTCLLQYALMSSGVLRKEALKQAKNFPDRIWFFDNREHFRRRRQMVQLPDKPKLVKLLEPDTCLIVLDNNCIYVADLSLDYSIESTKFVGHNSNIINLQIFNKNYLITCDIRGELRIWSIADERRRHSTLYRRQSIKRVINYINYQSNPRYREKECIQSFNTSLSSTLSESKLSKSIISLSKTVDPKSRIHNFYIEKFENNEILLYLIYGNGDIIIYRWYDIDKKFKQEKLPILRTDIPNIRYLLKLFERYFLILNNSGSLKIFKLSDFSSVCFSFEWPRNTTNPINLHSFYYNKKFYIIFVFTKKILQLQLPQQSFEFIKGDLYTLYEIKDSTTTTTATSSSSSSSTLRNNNQIKCSTITDDNKYLIIGTKYGLIVLDAIERSELLRNTLSECIQCLDVYSLDDEIYKYIVVSGSDNKKLLNIYGLKLNGNESLIWANSIGTLFNENNYYEEDKKQENYEKLKPQFEPNTWLLSDKTLFDVNFNNKKTSFVAIDSKNRIHQLIDNIWRMTLPGQLNSPITTISTFNNEYFIGCENGDIFHSSEMKLNNTKFEETIIFMEFLELNLLIASSLKCSIVYYNKIVHNLNITVNNCYKFYERYLILFNKQCTFLILDLFNNCSILDQYSDCKNAIGVCDLKANTFVIATVKGEFYVYKLDKSITDDNETLNVRKYHFHKREEHIESNFLINIQQQQQKKSQELLITTIALSHDAGLCAVGFNSGHIEIYKIDKKWIYLQQLDSHLTNIYDLKFSPWTEPNMPIILVSCSEQLCFWNISYILNNPLDDIYSYRRRSSRFSSTSINHNNTNTNTTSNCNNNLEKVKSQSLNNLSNTNINSNNNNNNSTIFSTSSTCTTPSPSPLSPLSLSSSSNQSPFLLNYNSIKNNSTIIENLWLNKKGSYDKPELNACIKFIGNKAEKFYTNDKFTEFLTIDDEGEFYYLIIQNLNDNNDNDNDKKLLYKNNGYLIRINNEHNEFINNENNNYDNNDDSAVGDDDVLI